MSSQSNNPSRVFVDEFRRALVAYFKIFLISIVTSVVFFYLYAGVKTDYLSPRLVAAILAIAVVGLIATIGYEHADLFQHVLKRTEELLAKTKYLSFGLALLILLIYELVKFSFYFLLEK